MCSGCEETDEGCQTGFHLSRPTHSKEIRRAGMGVGVKATVDRWEKQIGGETCCFLRTGEMLQVWLREQSCRCFQTQPQTLQHVIVALVKFSMSGKRKRHTSPSFRRSADGPSLAAAGTTLATRRLQADSSVIYRTACRLRLLCCRHCVTSSGQL